MVNKRPPFEALRDPATEQRFNQTFLSMLEQWDFKVITVLIDKKAHHDQYTVWRYHPYHYCLAAMLERFVLFLHYGNHCGDIMVESRGSVEDRKLKESYRGLYERGTDHISAQRWQERLTSKELKVKPKSANIAGLQLADIVAHPSRREMLLQRELLDDDRHVFGDQVALLLQQCKYYRDGRTGRIDGYGRKFLP